jgi:hypothetical protein
MRQWHEIYLSAHGGVNSSPRQGWAQAAAELVGQGDDALIMGEFGNASEEDLQW